MCEVERFGLALLDYIAKSSKPERGVGFEIASFSEEAKKIFVALACGEDCSTEISKMSSIRERAVLIYWQHLRRCPAPGLVEYFDTVANKEDHFRNYEIAALESKEYADIGRFTHADEDLFAGDVQRQPKIFIDVSNTVNSKARTGIQRVVREVGRRLGSDDQATLIYTNRNLRKFVELKASDVEIGAQPELTSAPSVAFRKGDLYVDLDASWGEPFSNFRLYAALKKAGVRIVTMHHDTVPILFSNFSHTNTVGRFVEHFIAALTFSDRIICNSKAVRADLLALCDQLKYRRPKVSVIRLGSDFEMPVATAPIQPEVMEVIKDGPYVLCVGTVEPRKNYSEVLACLPQLRELGLKLVIVGKVGWEDPAVIKDLEDAAQNPKEFVWLKNANDSSLNELYKHCELLIAASFYEGFGLPIIEGLSRHCVVISSDGGAQPEVLGDRGVVFCLNESGALANAIVSVATNEQRKAEFKKRTQSFVPANWQDTIADLRKQFNDFFGQSIVPKSIDAVQLVYISIRPNDLARSLASFKENFTSTISDVLVLTRTSQKEEMSAVVSAAGFSGTVLCDEEIIPASIQDHAERNYALRAGLFASKHTADVFLALDDDAVLLRPASMDYFMKSGVTSAFCTFPSLSQWRASPFAVTSYDAAQWRSGALLSQFGYSEHAFSAHQPQVIVKRIAEEVLSEFNSLSNRQLDEWSIYFNIASSRYPECFEVRRSTTLFWPDRLNSWQPDWFADDIYFENFYAHNYEEGGLAYELGLKPQDDWRTKRALYAGEYNKYYFQRLLDEGFGNISASIVEASAGPGFSNEAVLAFANLWKPVTTECQSYTDITYEVRKGSKLVVSGQEQQTIGRNNFLYVKCPKDPGRYQLHLSRLGIEIARANLVVLPVAAGALD